jgi:hypothetical protein
MIKFFSVLSIFVVMISVNSIADAVEIATSIYPPGSKPYDRTYGEWSAKWWQWAFSIPSDRNPINDTSGKYCSSNQNDSNVWFLAGSGGAKVIRSCTIPPGKAIFFPIMDGEWSYAESPTSKTESDLRTLVHADQDTVSQLTLKIDGVRVQNLTKFRADSPLFNFSTPKNGIFDLHSVTSQAVSDGFFVMLKPLSKGTHEIHWSGVLGSPTTTSPLVQPEDVTYRITIK